MLDEDRLLPILDMLAERAREFTHICHDILEGENIINKDLAKRLKEARGMRNIIAHQYGKINDEIVFESITSELIKDVGEFLDILE